MFIELAHHLDTQTAKTDAGVNPPRVIARKRIADGASNNTSYIETFVHTSTHVDAPWHFNDRGRKINDFAIEEFVFEKVLFLDIPKGAWQTIERADLEAHAAALADCDALIIRTGIGALRATDWDTYSEAHPGLTVEAAQYLAGFKNLGCLGVDFVAIENLKNNRPLNYPVHHALLDRDAPMLIIEDAKLDELRTDRPIRRLYLFPLRIEGIEASPVTPVVEI